MSKRLEGKVAVITGSTFGIGRGTAMVLAEAGAKVVVNGRNAEQGQRVVDEIRQAGGEATFYQGDITAPGAVEGLVNFAAQRYGRLDVMMNNAYHGKWKDVSSLSEAEWDRGMDILLRAVYQGCRYAIPHMIKQGGGSIINISSVHGYMAAHNFLPYEPAKAGVINLTRQVAVDFGKYNIRVNAICPGAIRIERTKPIFEKHPELSTLGGMVYPLRRVGQPREIGYAALFLASDDSTFVSGHALVVDGGMTVQLHDQFFDRYESFYRQHYAQAWGIEPQPREQK